MDFKKIAIVIIAILLIIIATLLYVRGDEDSWVCVNDKWEKHGNPDSAKPLDGCGQSEPLSLVTNFEECVAAGNPVMESYPRQCRDAKGALFVEVIEEATTSPDVATSSPENTKDLATGSADIILDYPQAEAKVKSPLTINGKARGTWFFEASFPVTLTNWDGLIIAEGVATAESDWMTEDYVPFTATLEYEVDTRVSNRGALILKKDNPSGLPENDDFLEITVFFE